MSDIDDILGEFDAPPSSMGGVERYIPDPTEFGSAYDEAVNRGWNSLKEAGSDIWNKGANPWNVGQAALAGLDYLASPFTALGRYLGGPVQRGVTDLTGSPTAGQLVGDTVALAPLMAAPFPGASVIKAAPEAAGMMAGEFGGARMATEHLANKFAARGAPVMSQADDEFESLVDEANPSRTTSRAKELEDEVALRWYQAQFEGGGTPPDLPPVSTSRARDVRLLERGNPRVGQNKYARDEAGQPVTIEGFEPSTGAPTYRTGAQAAQPTRQYPPVWDEGGYPMTNLGTQTAERPAPLEWYERQFDFNRPEGQSPAGQTPLLPGVRPEVLSDMYLPNVREQSQLDPRLLAELRLKFGGGSPQGGTEPPWMQQQTAGIRPPAEMPVMGASPMQPRNPNVIFPPEGQPVPMGVEARQNANRLRTDLGLPADEAEVTRKTREPLASRPPIPEKPITPAEAPRAVTQYGEIEVGQPYDIVMKMGGQEMRSPGGTVTELLYKNEPVVEKGKSVTRPVGYAVLEDGRQVPVKLLQRTGTNQPNVQMSAPKEPAPSRAQPAQQPITQAPGDQEIDPAFSALQKKMAAKTGAPKQPKTPKPNVEVKKGSKEALSDRQGQINRNWDMGLKKVRENMEGDSTYLHHFSGPSLDSYGAQIKSTNVAKKLNEMIQQGDIKIVGENSGKEIKRVSHNMLDEPDALDEDFVVTFLKKKKAKAEKK